MDSASGQWVQLNEVYTEVQKFSTMKKNKSFHRMQNTSSCLSKDERIFSSHHTGGETEIWPRK